MPLATGSRLGPYEVAAQIGAGGMGEVYRALDTNLGRPVAIKVLPEAVAVDRDRLARFEREARILAALNHPNIAAIYGLERSSGTTALVMELVEGDTVADRLSRGPIPIDQALPIAAEIAAALEAAHEQGIVHRDLKPANVKVRPDGRVKVLDFGLAKGPDDVSQMPFDSNVATAAPPAVTHAGLILGTVSYMSPEQTRGAAVDKRTDVWSFGCMLYEMLSGAKAFGGATAADSIAATLSRDPDWDALPPETPTHVRRLLARCLEKDASNRFRDIADARLELQTKAQTAPTVVVPAKHRTSLIWGAAMVAIAGLVGVTWFLRSGSVESGPTTRTTLALPSGYELDTVAGAPAISPDGRQVVYSARVNDRSQLFLRSLDAFDARPLSGTEGARFPFFSPSGQEIAFFVSGRLQRVSLDGGVPQTICDVPQVGQGATWSPQGVIVFDAGEAGLLRVPASGGTPQPVSAASSANSNQEYSWPQFLPDGRHLFVTIGSTLVLDGQVSLGVLSLETGVVREIGPGSQGQYLPSGHLLFHAPHNREGELDAVPFDPTTQTVQGTASPVVEGVFRAANGGAALFAVSQTGVLVYAPGGAERTLVSLDRGGRRTSLVSERRGFRFPRFSPDGERLAITIDPRPSQVWVYDLARGSRMALATDGHSITPQWTPDGQRVAFSSQGDLYSRAADGSSAAELLLARPRAQYPTSWSPDGRTLAFDDDHPTNGFDIWELPQGGSPRPLLATPASEWDARFSPDGRWLAYQSNESGRFEVYVRPYPDVNARKWTISTEGGRAPVWSLDGRELFYMNGATVMAVQIDVRSGTFAASTPTALFDAPFDTTQGRPFDVSPDGKRFVGIEADPDARPNRVQAVVNWFAELQRLAPGRNP